MLILLDLDGTLVNTVYPDWKTFKDGQENYNRVGFPERVPVFSGAKEFIESRKSKGDNLVVVSDSHPKYVEPICKMLGLESVSLADKPNLNKMKFFLDNHAEYKRQITEGDCVVIGDTKLDIEFGRKLEVCTVWLLIYNVIDEIKDSRDGTGDEIASRKMGPTYEARTFRELEEILDHTQENLYSIESVFAGSSSSRVVNFSLNRYQDGSFARICCLARQEQGVCDKYARADKYFMMSRPDRSQELLRSLAKGVSLCINHERINNQTWDYFTYLTDKRTTVPPNKLKEIFDIVDTSIPKVQLLRWNDGVDTSLRNMKLYAERQSFLQKYLDVKENIDDISLKNGKRQVISVAGKNIIVLDDQLTTSATAWHVIRRLKQKGARNILFIAMFQMVLDVKNDMICPRCGMPMHIKIKRSDGHRFYSCTPSCYGGNGCGYIIDIPHQ